MCQCVCECMCISVYARVCGKPERYCLLVAESLILNFFHCESFLPTVQGCFFHTARTLTRGHLVSPRGGTVQLPASVWVRISMCVCRLLVLSFLFLGNRRNRKLSKQLEAFAFHTHRYCSLCVCLYVCLLMYIYRCMHNIRLKFVNNNSKCKQGQRQRQPCDRHMSRCNITTTYLCDLVSYSLHLLICIS